ncbi:MAG TPA: 16S rRNA (cytidine(1402)-2'-O)-methyltransferase [Candidatus Dormibacteraeota bacterium]|jgi:16S rRNA (cytidine1402-2'-O)-methyltransferase|nr:16S rRNA (cytidine(1402)-2'-O)-methyltransferase [Candidatus Dormibacteraeota bacterium]
MGTLYVVATPIGNLEDITLRALRVLGEVALIAAEDTRVTSRLLTRHGIRKAMVSYRAPVEQRQLSRLLSALRMGDVALVSDAGTPTLSDPGQALVDAAWEDGHDVVPIPGPSAITSALAVAGFKGKGFSFSGYLPRKPGELRRFFETLRDLDHPIVAFESPHRVRKSLAILQEVDPERRMAATREMTKVHEEVLRGTAEEILAALDDPPRGEFTLVFASD